MKQLIVLILFFCLAFSANTRGDDLIKYQGQLYPLQSFPLMQHPSFGKLHTDIISITGDRSWIECGYRVTREVIKNEVYLIDIRSCTDSTRKPDLSKLFGSSYKNGRVKADWINEKLYVQQGKPLHYEKYKGATFQWEVELNVVGGSLTSATTLDNNGTRISRFTTDPETTWNFIHKQIRWSAIPYLGDQKIRVAISVRSTGTGKPEISILRGNNDLYATEALRVARLIPEWDVYYKRGKPVTKSFGITVMFSEENRRKFASRVRE